MPIQQKRIEERVSATLPVEIGNTKGLTRDVSASGKSLAEVVKADPAAKALGAAEIDKILDPLNQLGATQEFIESALASWKKAK